MEFRNLDDSTVELSPDELEQLEDLGDWLQEEGIRQEHREGQPPLQLVSA
jgi:hypothetical protein